MKRGKILTALSSLAAVSLAATRAAAQDAQALLAQQQALLQQAQSQAAGAGSSAGTMMIWTIVIGLAVYVYVALALMTIAKKTNTPRGWMAWIPGANLWLMKDIAKAPLWSFFVAIAGIVLAFIPSISIVGNLMMIAVIIWWAWLICPKMGRPEWWALLLLIPIVDLVVLWMMAWGKPKVEAKAPVPLEQTQAQQPAPVQQPAQPVQAVPVTPAA